MKHRKAIREFLLHRGRNPRHALRQQGLSEDVEGIESKNRKLIDFFYFDC